MVFGLSREERIKRQIHEAVHLLPKWKSEGISRESWQELLKLPTKIYDIMQALGLEMASPGSDRGGLSKEWDAWSQYHEEIVNCIRELKKGNLRIVG